MKRFSVLIFNTFSRTQKMSDNTGITYVIGSTGIEGPNLRFWLALPLRVGKNGPMVA